RYALSVIVLKWGVFSVWTTRDIDGTTVSDISDEGSGDDSLKDANVEVV
ncbi:3425_t:CDS:2, partial [Paraglomus brasilianum]